MTLEKKGDRESTKMGIGSSWGVDIIERELLWVF
jgi:hypothetical protein